MYWYRGGIHIHSIYSDGEGTLEEIIEAGQAAGLDYLTITDHNTLRAREKGYEGWHDSLLVSVGEEVSYSQEHCLSLGLNRRINGRQSTRRIVDEIEAQGGVSIVVHPYGRYRMLLRQHSYLWHTWDAPFTGIELWSYMFDWIKDVRYYNLLRRYSNPDAFIQGPHAETIATWDALTRQRQVVAIGGLDVHARRLAGRMMVVFPYRQMFDTLLTYIITDTPLTREASADLPVLYDAFRAGHCYLSFEPLHRGNGFSFRACNADGEERMMGDELRFLPPVELQIALPTAAEGRLLRDGVVYSQFTGQTHGVSVTDPGVYRVEARLDGRPWLYSNPIYVKSVWSPYVFSPRRSGPPLAD